MATSVPQIAQKTAPPERGNDYGTFGYAFREREEWDRDGRWLRKVRPWSRQDVTFRSQSREAFVTPRRGRNIRHRMAAIDALSSRVDPLDWRRRLARGVAWILALKLIALVLLKALLFPAAALDAPALQRQLGLDAPAVAAPRGRRHE